MGGVGRALESDLAGMPERVQASTLAAVARTLAGQLDEGIGARDAASVAKEIRACVADLRVMADMIPEEADPIDELARRKAARQSDTDVPQRARRAGGQLGG